VIEEMEKRGKKMIVLLLPKLLLREEICCQI